MLLASSTRALTPSLNTFPKTPSPGPWVQELGTLAEEIEPFQRPGPWVQELGTLAEEIEPFQHVLLSSVPGCADSEGITVTEELNLSF